MRRRTSGELGSTFLEIIPKSSNPLIIHFESGSSELGGAAKSHDPG